MFNQLKLTKLVMQNMVVQIHRNDETNLVFEQLGNPMTQIYKCDNEFPKKKKKSHPRLEQDCFGRRALPAGQLHGGHAAYVSAPDA